MVERGLFTVLQHLRDGPSSDCTEYSFKDPATKKVMYKFQREHLLVTVELFESDGRETMRLIPMHAKRGFSFDKFVEEVRTFPVPEKNDDFMNTLREALDVAT